MASIWSYLGFSKKSEKRSSNNLDGAGYSLAGDSILRMLGIEPGKVTVNAKNSMGIAAFYGCIRTLSDLVGTQPLSVYKATDQTGASIDYDHPLHDIIRTRFNSQMSSYVGRRMMIANLKVYGFAIAKIIRDDLNRPTSLIPYPSNCVSVLVDPNTGFRFFHVLTEYSSEYLTEDEVLFLKDLSFDGREGGSVVRYQELTLRTELLASTFLKDYYEKGTFAGGFLSTPNAGTNDQVAKTYKDRIIEALQGNAKGGMGLAVLGPGVTYQSVTRSPVESQLAEFFNKSESDISMFFGIPLSMIGKTEKVTSYGTGVEQITIGVLNTVIIPIATQFEQELDYKCFRSDERKKGYYTRHNFRNLLRGDAASYAEYVVKMIQNGIYSQDEVRSWDEMPPIPNGQGAQYWLQRNMMTLEEGRLMQKAAETTNTTP